MAPTTRQAARTKHKLGTTIVGEEVLDLVMPYIHDVEDRSSVSLVSRRFYETDGITRKCLTVHVRYYPNPSSLSKRFPFIQALTLKGAPSDLNKKTNPHMRITLWIEQLALEFSSLKELHLCGLVVLDEDLETLGRTRGKDLRSLKIRKCEGYSTNGLMHVAKHCNQLRTLCFGYPYDTDDGIWLHELALNSAVLERLHFANVIPFDSKYLTILAKNCCNSLISLKIGECYLSELGDAFRYAVRLEHFGGDNWDPESELVGIHFPPNLHSISIKDLSRYSIVLPLRNHIRKLKLTFSSSNYACQCFLFKSCPNLEVLYTADKCGDRGLQVIGKFCKKMRKLTHVTHLWRRPVVTHVGFIAVAKGCTSLESLKVRLSNLSNEALECQGIHLKNLRKFHVHLVENNGTLDYGIRAMLMGCSKLERLDMTLWHGGLSDVGLEYIGKYGSNLRSLSLTLKGNSYAGLVKLSEGCLKLRKLKLRGCPFSKQAVTSCVFNMPSLRYVWFDSSGRDSTVFLFTRPEFQL